MRTLQRTPPSVTTNSSYRYKYLNHIHLDGIVENSNIFEIDQNSCENAVNVYTDSKDRLVSRPALLKSDEALYDIELFGTTECKIYKSIDNKYAVSINGRRYAGNNDITNYKLCNIDNYIIFFNNGIEGAQVYDINTNNWTSFVDKLYTPISKITTGSEITYTDRNQFDENRYKEAYVYSTESKPILPKGDASVELTTKRDILKYDTTNTDVMTDYKLLRTLNVDIDYKDIGDEDIGDEDIGDEDIGDEDISDEDISDEDIGNEDISDEDIGNEDIFIVKNDTYVIVKDNYFLFSLNKGETWTKQYFPDYVGTKIGIYDVDDESGNYFFFVTSQHTYRYSLIENSGEFVSFNYVYDITVNEVTTERVGSLLHDNLGNVKYIFASFANKDTFCIIDRAKITANTDGSYIYLTTPEQPNLKAFHITTKFSVTGVLDVINFNSEKFYNFKLIVINEIAYLFAEYEAELLSIAKFHHICILSKDFTPPIEGSPYANMTALSLINIVNSSNLLTTYKNNKLTVLIDYTNNDKVDKNVYYFDAVTEKYKLESSNTIIEDKNVIDVGFNLDNVYIMSNGYLYYKADDNILYISNYVDIEQLNSVIYESKLDKYLQVNNPKLIYTDYDTFYLIVNNRIVTNQMIDNDIYTLLYYNMGNKAYTAVPSVCYYNEELYLGFGNELYITKNIRENGDIQFYLPTYNKQTFIEKISAIKNISTSETAIYFNNSIVLCQKVSDDKYGYAYSYPKTKLSIGCRLGDSIVNTDDGQYTIFPTQHGLAIMSYQAYMATTDQKIQYISDKCKQLWLDFYKDSEHIKIVQLDNIIYLSNESNTILLLDMRDLSWWKWELPIDGKLYTDNTHLKIINDYVYYFDDTERYFDFDNRVINWYIVSQKLHFGAPTYTKNIKELVFNFNDDKDEATDKSIQAQVRVYRKKIDDSKADIIDFTIESLRTFVKRFNYWKINEMQWGLSNDTNTVSPKRLILNGISVKYSINEEVR